jgi:hypothetical protein
MSRLYGISHIDFLNIQAFQRVPHALRQFSGGHLALIVLPKVHQYLDRNVRRSGAFDIFILQSIPLKRSSQFFRRDEHLPDVKIGGK